MATSDDFEEAGEVFRRAIRELASRDYSPAQIAAWSAHPDDKELWAAGMATRMNFLAVNAERILGFAQYEPPDHIGMSYVRPECARKGVGRALLGALEREAERRGVRELHTEASVTAKPFFAACGFEAVLPQIVRVRGVDFLNYRMRKRVG
jgi:putative acetyltransferase